MRCYDRILYGATGPGTDRHRALFAIDFARRLGAPLTILCDDALRRDMEQACEADARRAEAPAWRGKGHDTGCGAGHDVIVTDGADTLSRLSAQRPGQHDLTIVNHHANLFANPIQTKTFMNFVHGAQGDVLVLKQGTNSLRNIVAAIGCDNVIDSPSDRSLNEAILEAAYGIATRHSATLHVVHAWDVFARMKITSKSGVARKEANTHAAHEYSRHGGNLHNPLARLSAIMERDGDAPVTVRSHLPRGVVPASIMGTAEGCSADLTIVGMHDHGVLQRLLFKSTAEHILRGSGHSTLVVRRKTARP